MAAAEQPISRKRRERSSEPLILCGHGIALRIENGTLLVKNGFTHHPQTQELHRYFRGDLGRPSRIIVLDGSGALTFDVLDWLAEQAVPLIRVSWTGQVITVAGGSGYGADRQKIEWQKAMRADEPRRVLFSCDLIRRKLEVATDMLQSVIPRSSARDSAVKQLQTDLTELEMSPPNDVIALRGIEARAGAAYFNAWHEVPIQWVTAKRRPIPEAWRCLGLRSALRAGKTSKNQNATHPVNAMLNYGYAVAVGQLKLQALARGYDPTIGIMHHGYRGSPAFALDLVEPIRPEVDRKVLQVVLSEEMHPSDFVLTVDGECRLNPQLARRVAELASLVSIRCEHMPTGISS